VELVMQPGRRPWSPSTLALAREYSRISLSTLPAEVLGPWWELASRLRQASFYLRFLKPEYEGSPELRERARSRAPRGAVRLGEWIGRGEPGRHLLVRLINLLEQSTRTGAAFHQYLRDRHADVVVITPLVVLKTAQLDLARAARELGVRNAFAVASWDHLSSKSTLTFQPQSVIVWNEIQKREAVELHQVEADRVVVTGSQLFDDWFSKQPSTTREAFCARMGFRPDRPILLYACSSLLEGSPSEAPFVLRWVQHLRTSTHPLLRECGILVRPHFNRRQEWKGIDFAGLGNVACWPSEPNAPADASSKADYFDSLYHADATVGLNTSAMIEAAIVGRPVFTVLLPEFRSSQEGTIHFHYLLDDAEGVLRAARSLDEHVADLAAVLDGRGADPDRSARFVRTFVRPRGLEIPATVRFVDALEQLAALPPPTPVAAPPWTHLVRPLLWPFALAAAARARRSRDRFRRRKEQLLTEHRRRKAADTTRPQRQP
jgi:hypothetical protein